MSVLIKNMKMPESCSRCLLMVGTFCDVLVTDVDPFHDGANKRHASCPLIELPEKHGRLVDADDLIADYDRVHVGEPGGARILMENALTIIEAEGDE